jgi:hypothetical protein
MKWKRNHVKRWPHVLRRISTGTGKSDYTSVTRYMLLYLNSFLPRAAIGWYANCSLALASLFSGFAHRARTARFDNK